MAAGESEALEVLRVQLASSQADRTKPAYLAVPGIDVPFHSSALRDGVADFRKVLDDALPPLESFTALARCSESSWPRIQTTARPRT